MECSPGGRFLISSLIRTPGAASVRAAVPMLCPEAFLISTTTGFGAGFATELQATTAGLETATAEHARIDRIFIVSLPKADFLTLRNHPIFRAGRGAIHNELV